MSTPSTILNALSTLAGKTVRGIRDSIPQGYVIGRASSGNGPAELIDIGSLAKGLQNSGLGGAKFANPTATASDTAVNGSAVTAMRSDAAPAVQKASSSAFGIVKVDGTTITARSGVISSSGGATFANPTATASDTAVNGSATTAMRSDAAPAVQKASSSAFGVVKVDGTTITASGGVISAAGGSGSGGILPSTFGGMTEYTQNGACQGNLFSVSLGMSFTNVYAYLTTVTSGTYKIGIAPFNTGTSQITTAPTYSNVTTAGTGATDAWLKFTFASAQTLTAGTYLIFVVRTDATAATPLTMAYPGNPLLGPGFTMNVGYWLASLAPATTDTWNSESYPRLVLPLLTV